MSFRGNSIKKFLALLWLSLFFISMLAACGGDSGSAAPDNGQSVGESDPDLAEGQEVRLEYISERLLKEITYEEELVALAPEVFYNLFGIEEADVAEQYNYFSGGATSEEIVVMKATSAAPAEDPIVLRFDRPFVCGIVDLETGAPLFLGTVENLT